MKDHEKRALKGIRIRTFNTCMIILSALIFAYLIYQLIILPRQYYQLVDQSRDYLVCQQDAADLSSASDYLTEQVQLCVQNLDIQYMENYFYEVHVTRRRENAVADLERHQTNQAVRDSLQAALTCSNDLMDREIYAMKLIALANDFPEEALPEEVRTVQLKAVDAALAPEEMIELARTMVFDLEYQDAKALIRTHLDDYLNEIFSVLEEQQAGSETALGRTLVRQRLMICMLFVLNVITFVVITLLIVRPLTIYISRIKENHLLDITGSYEFKYLALTYNDIYELNASNQALLAQKAEHDALTGLMNRGAFDELTQLLHNSPLPFALLIADVDHFKNINDTFGHEAGDQALKKVAVTLQHIFRSTDYVARLGGDEFAVIMTELGEENRKVVEEKVQRMNQLLMNPSDGQPQLSISAGVAFSERGFAEDLFRKADRALYDMKRNGRKGCCIYDASASSLVSGQRDPS